MRERGLDEGAAHVACCAKDLRIGQREYKAKDEEEDGSCVHTIHTFCTGGLLSLGGSQVAGRCSLGGADKGTEGERTPSAIHAVPGVRGE